MIKISVIVPVYNTEKYLRKCLDSIVFQDNKNYEIIAINDGSTDNSESILKEYQKKYNSIFKYFSKKNGGLSSARNYGIKKATGDYLLFVDSDDYIEKNTINHLINIIDDQDIIVFNINSVNNDTICRVNTFNSNIDDLKKRYLVSIPSACNKLVKKDLLIKNNLYFTEGIFYEDLMLMPKLVKYTNKIFFDESFLYNYVVRSGSITNNKKFNIKTLDIFNIVDSLYNELFLEYKDEVEYLYIEHLLHVAGVRFLDYKKYNEIDKTVSIIKEKFPNWKNNIYVNKNYNIKEKIMCFLLYKKKYKLINLLRK